MECHSRHLSWKRYRRSSSTLYASLAAFISHTHHGKKCAEEVAVAREHGAMGGDGLTAPEEARDVVHLRSKEQWRAR